MFNRVYLGCIAITLMSMASTSICKAQQTTQPPVKSEVREAWRKSLVRSPLPKNGCFKVEYPGTAWQEVPCVAPSKEVNAPQRKGGTGAGSNTVGDTSGDFYAESSGLLTQAEGSFNSVDVTGGTDSNVFMLQLNTQFFNNPPACNGVAGCQGWQQFLWSPTQCPGTGSCVFMEYWLIGYGTCPGSPWTQQGPSDCDFNTYGAAVPIPTVADLTGVTLTATASAGGQDKVIFGPVSGTLYAVGNDSVLSLANYWNSAEFNAFGNGGGSETTFSNPTTLVVKTTIDDGTTNAPSCQDFSFTAEQNNLNLVTPCCYYGGATPNIQFMETNAGHTASCGPTQLLGDPHLTTEDGTHYNFQGAGEFVSLRDFDGDEIQTRQKPVSTTFIGNDPYDGLTTCVSLNSAVAARVGTHRVTWEPNLSGVPDPSGLQLRIDGALTTLSPQGVALGTGGRVSPQAGGALEVDFPDGKTLLATPQWWASQSEWYLNVDISNLGLVSGGSASSGTPSLAGIVAPIVDGSWLPALPNGASLGPMPSGLPARYNTLYKKFADAWRVNDKDSLFDYAPGTSTESFTNKDWPPETAPCIVRDSKPLEPASEAVAQQACRRVMDRNMRADCVFDVRVTGDVGFATTYLATQRTLNDSTSTSLTDDPDPSETGEWVTFTALVVAKSSKATGRPSGTVQFAVDGLNAGEPVTVDAKGRAKWSTSQLKVGTHRITASYVPGVDTVFLPSTSLQKLQTVKRCFCEAERDRK